MKVACWQVGAIDSYSTHAGTLPSWRARAALKGGRQLSPDKTLPLLVETNANQLTKHQTASDDPRPPQLSVPLLTLPQACLALT